VRGHGEMRDLSVKIISYALSVPVIILKRAVKEDENGVAVQKHDGF
jgi:hypothetical protein